MVSETPVVDFGAHYHTTVPSGLEDLHDVIGPIAEDPAAYAEWFGDGGYDAAVLSQPYYLGYDDASFARRVNDELADVVAAHESFYGLAAIPTAAGGEAAAAEFERCLDRGLHGGAMAIRPEGIDLIDEANDATFEVADREGAPILVHPTSNDRLATPYVPPRNQNDMAFGREAALCAAISDVVQGDLLDRYPDLSLVFHHTGGNIAAMLGRLSLRLDHQRWGRDGTGTSADGFAETLASRIYVDTSGYFADRDSLRCALELFDPSQVLLGTDAPYEPRTGDELEAYVDVVGDLVGDSDADAILGGNAVDLLVDA